MTNTIATAQLKAANSYLEREISSALIKALSAMFGGEVTAGKSEPKAPQDCFCVKQTFNRPEIGSVLLVLERSSATKLGNKLLTAKGLEVTGEEQAISSVKDTFTQLGANLAGSLSAQLKCEIRGAALIEESSPVLPDQSFAITVTIGNESFGFTGYASSELLESLAALDHDAAQNALVPVTAIAARNLDLLLDVEMPVSISFGRAQLPLKDVFKLTIGSMVELNRATSEPVEVIVNNSVIAQGEVVVVEGNFGVRITHVMSKHDRIRSLT